MNVGPDQVFEAVIDTGATGLVGTIGVTGSDNTGATAIAFTSSPCVEIAPGVYAIAGLAAPATRGQYTLIWRQGPTGTVLGVEDLTVTSSSPSDAPAGTTYVTTDDLFRKLKIRTPTADQVADATRVLTAAKVEIDSIMGRTDPLDANTYALAAQVNLERGEELWQETESPFGIIGLGSDIGPMVAPRRSRALAKLTPLKQTFGAA